MGRCPSRQLQATGGMARFCPRRRSLLHLPNRAVHGFVPSIGLPPQLDAVGEGTPQRLPFDVGTLRLRATATEASREVFIGIAPQTEVDAYLAGVHHTELRDVKFQPFRSVYRDVPGSSTPAVPGAQQFWAASASGPGEQELTWNIAPGNWTVVVMLSAPPVRPYHGHQPLGLPCAHLRSPPARRVSALPPGPRCLRSRANAAP